MRISLPVVVSTVLVWASGYPAGALGVAAAPPLLLTATRFALAALVMTLIALAGRAVWPRGRQLAHVAVTGLLLQAIQFCGVYGGLHAGVPAAVSAPVIALNPVLTAVLAAGLLRERIGRARLAGLGLGVAAVISALGDRVAASGRVDAGTALTVLGLVGFSAGGVYQQRFCQQVDIRSATAVQFVVSAPVVAALALFEPGRVTNPAQAGAVVLWLVLINSAAGSALFLSAVRRSGAASATTVFSLVPPVTAVISWPVLGQVPSLGAVIGVILGALACALGTRASSSARNASTSAIRPAVEKQRLRT